MVAVVSGNDLGLFNTSLSKLGQSFGGQPGAGAGNVSDYVNVATGNLILKNQEDLLVGSGLPQTFLQTYNSLGLMGQAGGWLSNFDSAVSLVSGILNAAGSTVQRSNGDGSVSLYQYDAGSGKYVSDDGAGAEDTLSFDAGSGQWSWVEGSSRNTMVYDSSGRLVSVGNALTGASFSLSYNGAGQLTQISDASGEALVLGYDAAGQLSSLGTQSGGVTTSQVTYGYDAQGRLTSVSTNLDPSDPNSTSVYTTTYGYDGNSLRVASVTQSDGSQVSFTYVEGADGVYRVQTVTQGSSADGSAQTTSFDYSVPGQTTVTDPLGRATTYTYDSDDRLTQVTLPAVNGQRPVITYSYTTSGQLQSVTDALGNITTYGYDANGNLIYRQDPIGDTVTRTYNADDQILTQTVYTATAAAGAIPVSGGETTRYVYGDTGLLLYTIGANGEVTANSYVSGGTANGLLQSTRTFLGATYDTSGLANDAAPSESDLDTWAATQGIGNTTLTSYSYDIRGQLSGKTVYASVDASGNGVLDAAAVLTQYTYDAQGLLRQSTTLTGADRTTAQTTSYVYDGLGRLISTTDALGKVTTQTHDDAGHSLVVTSANGLTTTDVYNAAGELVSVTQGGTGVSSRSTQYYYDAAGELTAVMDPDGGVSYTFYDADGRVSARVDATGAVTTDSYDADGRLTSTTAYATRVNTSGWLTNGVVTGTLTLPGSTAQDRTAQYFYDAAGRQVGTLDADGYLTKTVYDGTGQAVETIAYASLSPAGATSLAGAIPTSSPQDRITRYFYDADGRQVAALDAAGYLSETQYDAAGRISATIGYATATDPAQRASGTLDQLRPATDASHDEVTRMYHDAAGDLVGELDAEGYLTTYSYDQTTNSTVTTHYTSQFVGVTGSDSFATLMAAASGTANETTTCVYDALGRTQTETDLQGTVTRYVYDDMGNLTAIYTGYNTSEVRDDFKRYDLFGNLIGEMRGEGAAQAVASLSGTTLDQLSDSQLDALYSQYGTTYQYDARNQLTQSTDAQGNSTWYFYDADGRRTHTVNALGEVSENQYDAFGDVADTIQYAGTISTDPTTLANLRAAIRVALSGSATGTPVAFVNAPLGANDSEIQYTYYNNGQVHTKTDALGYVTHYHYDAFGDLTQLTSPLSASTSVVNQYVYDNRGLKVGTTEDVGTGTLNIATSATYDAFGRMTSSTDGNGNTVTYSYDRLGRDVATSQVVNGVTRATATTYDAFSRVLTRTDALNHVTQYGYNDTNRTMTVTTPEGLVTTTDYNEFGQTIQIENGAGDITQYSYDHSGKLTAVVNPDGNLTTHNSYNTLNQLISTVDGDGNTVAYTYDAVGRTLTRTTDPEGIALTTTYAYDAKGQQVSTTDAKGVVTLTGYDQDGNVLQVTVDPATTSNPHGLNLVTTYSYDAEDHQVTVTDGAGGNAARTTQYVYDDLGRLTQKIVDPSGLANTTSYAYDGNGNMTRMTDAGGNTTYYTYDEANERVYTLSPLGTAGQGTANTSVAVTRQAYDPEGRLVATVRYATAVTINPSKLNPGSSELTGAAATAYVAGLATAVANPSTDQASYTVYDHDGRTIYSVNSLGDVTQTAYNGDGQVTEQIAYANTLTMSSGTRSALLAGSYDETSFATPAASNNDHKTFTVYDAAGYARYIVNAATVFGTRTATVIRQDYDAAGNLTRSTSMDGTVPFNTNLTLSSLDTTFASPRTGDETTTYIYDAANWLRFTIDPTGAVTQNVYDGAGNVIEKLSYIQTIDPTGVETLAGAETAVARIPANTTLYQYDNAGRLTKVTDALGNFERYSYDATGLKLSYTDKNSNTINYVYDKAGNLTDEIAPPITVTAVTSTGGMASATGSQLRLDTHMTYDGMGNLITRTLAYGTASAATTQFQYDAAGNQFKTVTQLTGSYNFTTQSFTGATTNVKVAYDALGRAYANRDANGNWSYKIYDSEGHDLYDVDADGGVTGYTYDAFGQQTVLTRYANAINLSSVTAGGELTTTSFSSLLQPSSSSDRTLTMAYDAAGQKISVTQSSVSFVQLNASPEYYANNQAPTVQNGSPVTTYQYDAHGNLVEQSVRMAVSKWAVTYNYYDADNRQIMSVDPDGYVTTTNYTTAGQVASTTQFAQAIDISDITAATPPALPAAATEVSGPDRTTRYGYDAIGRRTQLITESHYESSNGTEHIADLVTTTTYDGNGNALSTTVNGATTTNTYDALGHLLSTTGPAHAVLADSVSAGSLTNGLAKNSAYVTASSYATYSYDAYGNLVAAQRYANGLVNGVATNNGADEVSYSQYDVQGHLVLSQDAMGNQTHYTYDSDGNLLVKTYGLQASTNVWQTITLTNTYDNVGRQLTSVLDIDYNKNWVEKSVSTTYNTFGEVTQVSTTNQNQSAAFAQNYTYDNAGRLTEKDSGSANTTQNYWYDLAGNQVVSGTATVYTYSYVDNLGRTVTQVRPSFSQDGSTILPIISTSYDRWGNVTQTVDARGFSTEYFYNDKNEVVAVVQPTTEVVDAQGNVSYTKPEIDYYYDIQGRQVGMRDANGNLTQTGYDAAGEVVETVDGMGYKSYNAYDALGRQIATQDGNGNVSKQTFDGLNNLLTQSAVISGRFVAQQSYTLNAFGNRLTSTDALSNTTSYTYDARGNVVASTSSGGVTMNYRYDSANNRVYYSDNRGTESWTYNAYGQLAGYTDLGGNTHTYSYNSFGWLSSDVLSGNGGERDYVYYSNGMLKTLNDSGDHEYYTYTYDADGNRTSEEDTALDGTGHSIQTLTTAEFDSHNRTTSVTTLDEKTGAYTLSMSYEYDAQGNRRHIRVQSSYGASTSPINISDATPVVMGNLDNISVRAGDSYSFNAEASDIFQDPESDALSFNAYMQNSSDNLVALPSWLSYAYDPVKQQFQFTANTSAGQSGKNYTIVLTATDGVSGHTPQQSSFTISVGSGLSPTIARKLPTVVADTGASMDYAIFAGDYFNTPYTGDSLKLSIDPSTPLPSWLTADVSGDALRLTGTPDNSDIGKLKLDVVATDEAGNSVSTMLTLVLQTPTPLQPIGTSPIPPQQATSNHAFSYSVAATDIFDYPSGDDPSFTVSLANGSPMPDWLQIAYDPNSPTPVFTFSGMPPDSAVGTYNIQIAAGDATGTGIADLSLTVSSNQPPAPQQASITLPKAQVHTAFSASWPIPSLFQDPNGDPMTFELETPTSPSDWGWLQLTTDGTNLTISGTPPSNDYAGTYTLDIVASDGDMTGSLPVTLTVTGDHSPVTTKVGISPPNVIAGQPYSYQIPAGAFTDPDGNPISYQLYSVAADGSTAPLSDASSWLSFDPSTATMSGTPPVVTDGNYPTYGLRLVASNGLDTLDYDFTLNTVVFTDRPPVVNNSTGQFPTQQTAIVNRPFTLHLPAGLFTDPDGEALTYSAQVLVPGETDMEDISDIGLSIDPNTGIITGTVTSSITSYYVQVTASDPEGADVSVGFTLNVAQPPTSPAIMTEEVYYGNEFSLNLVGANGFNDPNGFPMTFSLAPGSSLPTVDSGSGGSGSGGGGGTLNGGPVKYTPPGNNSNLIGPGGRYGDGEAGGGGTGGTGGTGPTYTYGDLTLSSNGTLSGWLPEGSWTFTVVGAVDGMSTSSVVTLNTVTGIVLYNGGLSTQTAPSGVSTSFTIPTGVFTDQNALALTYTAQQIVNGVATALPGSLSFDGNHTFSGTVPVGSYTLQITAADPNGASATAEFTVNVVDDKPVYLGGLTDQVATPGQLFVLPDPKSGTFSTPLGDGLTYSFAGAPPWLTNSWVHGQGYAWNGTPTTAGSWTMTVTAKNSHNQSISESFNIVVPEVAPVYAGALADQAATAGTSFTYAIPAGTFTAPNGDALTYTAGDLPAWLTFNAATQAFSGMPGVTGTTTVTVTATDSGGLSTSENFNITVADSAPTYTAGDIANQTATAGQAFSYQLPMGTFADPNGDALTISATGLPSWLSFDPISQVFSGTPGAAGTTTISATATDPSGLTRTKTFTVTVANVAPVYTAGTVSNQTAIAGQSFSYQAPAGAFTDANGDALTYTATGLPSWLTFNAATQTFTGTPTGTLASSTITLKAKDPSLLAGTTTFTINVVDVAPVYNGQNTSFNLTPNSNWSIGVSSTMFTDVGGSALTYTVAGLPSWMNFAVNSGDPTFSGSDTNTPGTWQVTLTATNSSGQQSSQVLSFTVPNNGPGARAAAFVNQTAQVALPYTYVLPANAFSDVNGLPLSYSVTGLPSWLSFNSSTRTFTGTPPTGTTGTSTITVTATDPYGLTAQGSFTLGITNNSSPLYQTSASVTWNVQPGVTSTKTLTSDFATNGGGAISYSIVSSNIPSWFSFNAMTGVITATSPTTAGQYTATFLVTDTHGDTATANVVINVANVAPVLSTALTNQAGYNPGASFSYAVPAGSFTDPNNDPLTYSASGMPAWMSFDPTTQTFSGIVAGAAGAYTVTMTATDPSGLSVSGTFTVTVKNVAPVYNGGLNNWTVQPGQVSSFTIPAGSFTDPNGDALTYSALQSSGAALPAWLTFNAATQTFTSTNQGSATTKTITVTATDAGGKSITGSFTVTVVALAPVYDGALTNQTPTAGQSFVYFVPTGAFTDPNAGALTYTTSTLPSWLTFNATTLKFSGTPPAGTKGSWTITVTATDPNSLSASGTFVISMNDTAPVYNGTLVNQTATASQVFSYKFAGTAFTDPDGDTLSYSASGMPSWLSFTPGTRTFSGMPTTAGSWTITVTGTDPAGLSTTGTFTITVPNAAPAYKGGGLANQSVEVGQGINYTIPAAAFTDANLDSLAYTVSGLPSWLTFNASIGAFSGTAPDVAGTYTLTVTATDAGGLSASGNFTVTVTDTAPVYVANSLTPQSAVGGQPYSYTIPTSAFTDVDGDPLTYTVSGMPSWLSFNAATGTFSGTPGAAARSTITVTATDPSGLSASGSFTLSVANVAPVGAVQNQVLTPGEAYSFAIPAGTFTDPNGGGLTYSVSGLPTWLSFNAATQTFSGTAPWASGSWTVNITAMDASGLTDSDNVTFSVVNIAPAYNAGLLVNQTPYPGQPFSYTLPAGAFTDPTSDPLTYTVSGLPSWLTYNSSTGTFSGTPTAANSWTVTVTATDPGGLSASGSFTVTVPNIAPVAHVSTNSWTVQPGTTASYTYPYGSFTDVNGGSSLSYTLTGLPALFSYTAQSGLITITANKPVAPGTWNVTVTARDSGGLSTSSTLIITVPDLGPVYTNTLTAKTPALNTAFSYQIPAGTFVDQDGNTLSAYSVSGVPSWLTFSPSTNTFSGTTPSTTGSWTITVSATDSEGLPVSASFTITPGELAPVYAAGSMTAQNLASGVAWSYQIPAGSFTDPNGDPLVYTTGTLPSWVSFDASTQTFSGTPPAGTSSTSSITVIAKDPSGHAITASLAVNVFGSGPVYQGLPTWTFQPDQYATLTLPTGLFTDSASGSLTYTVGPVHSGFLQSNPYPSWLSYDSTTQTFSGVAPSSGSWSVAITATDSNGVSTTGVLNVAVAAIAPEYSNSLGTWLIQPGQASIYSVPAGTFTDANGVSMTYSVAGLPSWMGFDSKSGTLYTVNAVSNGRWTPGLWNGRQARGSVPIAPGTWQILVTAAGEGGLKTAATLTVMIPKIPPTYNGALSDQYVSLNNTFSFTEPLTAFTNIYGHALSFTAVDLPTGVSFDPSTGTFSGTFTSYGTTLVGITATDTVTGLSTTAYFNLASLDNPPVFNGASNYPVQVAAVGQAFNWSLDPTWFTDSNDEALTYSATQADGQPLPSGLSWNPDTNTITGIPATGTNGTYTILVTAMDPEGKSATSQFTLFVDLPPEANVQIPDQVITVGTPWDYTLPAADFTSPGGDSLRYSATGLPTGVEFSSTTNSFTGTPTKVGDYAITVTATDSHGVSVSENFNVTVEDSSDDSSSVIMLGADQNVGSARSYAMGANVTTGMGPVYIEPKDPKTGPGSGQRPDVVNYWFTYDKDNRAVVVDGALTTNSQGNNVIVADSSKSTSYTQTYDGDGNVLSQNAGGHTLSYAYSRSTSGSQVITYQTSGGTKYQSEAKEYDLDGHLLSDTTYFPPGSSQNSVTPKEDTPNGASTTITVNISGWMQHQTSYTYNGDGQLLTQEEWARAQGWEPFSTQTHTGQGQSTLTLLSKTSYTHYDVAGNLTNYQFQHIADEDGVSPYPGGPSTTTYTINYTGGDTWMQSTSTGNSTNPDFKGATSTENYNDFNQLVSVVNHAESSGSNDSVRYLAYNGAGQIINKVSGSLDGNGNFIAATNAGGTADLTQVVHYYAANGQALGSVDEAGDIQFGGDATNFTNASPGDYTVQSGDTLQSIAQAIYGNQDLWYVIADANGITSNDDLRAGEIISYPLKVTSANNADTYKPYSQGEVVGSTAPNLPYVPPQSGGSGCSTLAMIVVIAVIIVATIFTAGAAAVAFSAAAEGAAATEGVMAVGAAALAGGTAAGVTISAGVAIGAAVVGGVVGNAVGQEVGVALGVQNSFSLTEALAAGATAGVTAGVGAEIGSSSSLFQNHQYLQLATSAVANNIGDYAVNRALGVQTHFSWDALAASAISADVSAGVLGDVGTNTAASDFVTQFGSGTINAAIDRQFGLASASSHDIATDAFGNVLGNDLAGAYTQRQKAAQAQNEKLMQNLKAQADKLRAMDQSQMSPEQLQTEKALTALLVSSDSYNGIGKSDSSALPNGVQRVDFSNLGKLNLDADTLGKLSNLSADTLRLLTSGESSLYYDSSSNQFYLGNRGTTASFSDLFTDLGQFAGLKTDRYKTSVEAAVDLQQQLGSNITFTGHSLGGGLADAESLATGLHAITFNAAGLSQNTIADQHLDTSRADDLITNYHVNNEVLTTTQTSPLMSAISDVIVTPIANAIEFSQNLFGTGYAPYSGITDIPAALGKQVELPAMDTFLNTNGTLESGQPLDSYRLDSPFTMLDLHGISNVAGGFEALIQKQFGTSSSPTMPLGPNN